MEVDIEKIKEGYVGIDFDEAQFTVTEDMIVNYARSVGEVDPRYTDPKHPDFRAPPTLTAMFNSRRVMPQNVPRIGRRGFDAGKSVEILGAVRPGDTLTSKSHIHDVYEKTGRSGLMVFIVHRMEFSNQKGEPVSIVDWRMVQQP